MWHIFDLHRTSRLQCGEHLFYPTAQLQCSCREDNVQLGRTAVIGHDTAIGNGTVIGDDAQVACCSPSSQPLAAVMSLLGFRKVATMRVCSLLQASVPQYEQSR